METREKTPEQLLGSRDAPASRHNNHQPQAWSYHSRFLNEDRENQEHREL